MSKGKTTDPEFWDKRRLIRSTSLPLHEKSYLLLVADYAGNDDVAFPSQEMMASDLSLSTRRVREIMTDLTKKGLLKVERLGRGNFYTIHWQELRNYSSGFEAKHRNSDSGKKRNSGSGVKAQQRKPGSGASNTHKTNFHRNTQGSGASKKRLRWKSPNGSLPDDEFRSLDAALPRLQEAVEAGYIRDTHTARIEFMALWEHVRRQHAAGKIRKPASVFCMRLISGDFTCVSNGDVDVANAFIKVQRRKSANGSQQNESLVKKLRVDDGDEYDV